MNFYDFSVILIQENEKLILTSVKGEMTKLPLPLLGSLSTWNTHFLIFLLVLSWKLLMPCFFFFIHFLTSF